MQHRISTGTIIEHEDRVLLVRHVKPGAYDFWVAPGGGVKGAETLDAAAREAHEEAGVEVAIGKLLYIEELFNPECRTVKFWFAARQTGGQLDWTPTRSRGRVHHRSRVAPTRQPQPAYRLPADAHHPFRR